MFDMREECHPKKNKKKRNNNKINMLK